VRVKTVTKRIDPKSTAFARKLREDQTDVEKALWYHLRNRQINDAKFRRQYTIGKYIVDFVCIEKKLIIELDGAQHNEDTALIKDKVFRLYDFGITRF
jgi:very-short-patch-repair endonuclease